MLLIEETIVPEFVRSGNAFVFQRHAMSMSHISFGGEITASGRCEVSVSTRTHFSLGIFLCGHPSFAVCRFETIIFCRTTEFMCALADLSKLQQ